MTTLTATGTPGRGYEIASKGSSARLVSGCTALSVMGVPGRCRTFRSKSETPIEIVVGGGYSRDKVAEALKTTDSDMIDMVYMIVASGILEQ